MRSVLLAAALLLASCATHRATAPAGLPEGKVWIEHLQRDLVPFWTMPDALGDPVGNFATFRCHDGRRFDRAAPCPELLQAGAWISENLDREYVRMQSRQIYFYAAAYHLTGDLKMLELADAGARWLREHAVDRVNGGVVSWWVNGKPDPEPSLRTAQDLAYAQLGPAMLYYVTRDPELLPELLGVKEHIFRTLDDGGGLLLWVRDDPAGDEDLRRELVAPLDQVNAYMLLLAPILPEPHRTEWKRDLVRLADGMIARYWIEDEGMFRGTLHEPKLLGSRHTDFGHTIKALWMIERIGQLTGRGDLVDFSRRNGARVLHRAWIPESGCWATSIRENGELDRTLVWWSFAELDQMAATLALSDASAARPLPASSRCWFGKMVDPVHHEVWGFVNPDDPSKHFAKAHLWKNGYHTAEHALVGYLTAQALHGKPSQLWFAFAETPEGDELRPYFFKGRVQAIERQRNGTRVTFDRLQ
ncbi:MAG TPA: AGE family epimerase/isomerase [Thermoanaerobaculia bacterium]|nr:AGE family epimerase/isomerase [Thermoanaerobaculia bacterium]